MTSVRQRVQRILRAVQTGWSIAGVTVFAVVAMEVGLRLAFTLKDHFSATKPLDRRVIDAGYGGESWPLEHYRELERLQDRWEPFVYFRQRPMAGTTISIDAEGLRRTWQPPPVSGEPTAGRAFKVLTLGGSSLWGYGARDDRTIPSLIARKLYERGQRVEVRNLAEIGYVSSQEVAALIRELQSGYRPDLVLFYDGVNDTTSALLEGEAGVTTNERNRRAEFNIRQSAMRLGAAMIGKLVEDSAIYRFARTIGRRLGGNRATAGGLPPAERRSALAADVVRRYRANVAIVDELGRGFGFHALYYWQPVVFDKRSLTPTERAEAEKLGWSQEFFHEVYQAIHQARDLETHGGFHDLSPFFASTPDLIFIDYCHTTETANERIAEVMARDGFEALRSERVGGRRTDPVR